MISCKEVATLLTTDQIRSVSVWKRLKIGLHMSMCRHCARLRQQLRQLGSAARLLRSAVETETAGDNLEARLLRKLGLKDK